MLEYLLRQSELLIECIRQLASYCCSSDKKNSFFFEKKILQKRKITHEIKYNNIIWMRHHRSNNLTIF